MKTTMIPTVAATVALFASSATAAIDPIVIKGSKFFHKNSGEQFFMKGIAYQRTTSPSPCIAP